MRPTVERGELLAVEFEGDGPPSGTFFARDIESHQDNVIQALPFGWDRDCVEFGFSWD